MAKYPSDFYVTCASVIPVLFLAVAVQGRDMTRSWHKDIKTTQRYANYAPSSREADMIAAAFARPETAQPVAAA